LADNWFAFNQIADRLDTIFSGPRGRKFVGALRKNFGVWTGNVALGFMLGTAAVVGNMTGLPIDIRHVTFSSGSFGIAWIHQEDMLMWKSFFLIAATVLCMGIINLSVSFSLSLFVAMKSRRLRFRQGRRLIWLLFKRLATRPYELFIDTEK
jgi:site-specific recombinase